MKFYFTFGFGQLHENCYIVIEATNMNKACEKMFQRFDRKWSGGYNSAEEAGVEEFNLEELK